LVRAVTDALEKSPFDEPTRLFVEFTGPVIPVVPEPHVAAPTARTVDAIAGEGHNSAEQPHVDDRTT
jgi:hypothetical protein